MIEFKVDDHECNNKGDWEIEAQAWGAIQASERAWAEGVLARLYMRVHSQARNPYHDDEWDEGDDEWPPIFGVAFTVPAAQRKAFKATVREELARILGSES